MRAWLLYAAVSLLVVAVGGLAAAALVGPEGRSGVWFAAVLAWVLQVAAFGALVALRGGSGFMLGWLIGLLLRFGAVGVVAFWLKRTPVHDPAATLVSLVAFVFVLLLMEPVFLRRGLQSR